MRLILGWEDLTFPSCGAIRIRAIPLHALQWVSTDWLESTESDHNVAGWQMHANECDSRSSIVSALERVLAWEELDSRITFALTPMHAIRWEGYQSSGWSRPTHVMQWRDGEMVQTNVIHVHV